MEREKEASEDESGPNDARRVVLTCMSFYSSLFVFLILIDVLLFTVSFFFESLKFFIPGRSHSDL